jgi:hypothetical protein
VEKELPGVRYGVRNANGWLHVLAQRPGTPDTEVEARRLAALRPGFVALERKGGRWVELPEAGADRDTEGER